MEYQNYNIRLEPMPGIKVGSIASVVKIVMDDNCPCESIFEPNEPLVEPFVQDAWSHGRYFELACKIAFEEHDRSLSIKKLPEFKHLVLQNIAKFIIVGVLQQYGFTTLINVEALIRVNLQIASIIESHNILQLKAVIDGKETVEEETVENIADILSELERNSAALQKIKERYSEDSKAFQEVKTFAEKAYTIDNFKL